MRALTALVSTVAVAIAVSAPVEARRPAPVDLAGMSFAVDVTVLQSTLPDLPAGSEFVNCYTFHPDGTWSDPAFPSPAAPVAGRWSARASGPVAGYVAVVDATDPLVLEQYGVALSSSVHPTRLVARTTLTLDDEVVARVRSVGTEVETCDASAEPHGTRRPVTPVRR